MSGFRVEFSVRFSGNPEGALDCFKALKRQGFGLFPIWVVVNIRVPFWVP